MRTGSISTPFPYVQAPILCGTPRVRGKVPGGQRGGSWPTAPFTPNKPFSSGDTLHWTFPGGARVSGYGSQDVCLLFRGVKAKLVGGGMKGMLLLMSPLVSLPCISVPVPLPLFSLPWGGHGWCPLPSPCLLSTRPSADRQILVTLSLMVVLESVS